MPNLFQKASIITTPTAYEDGVLNSVKPKRTLGSELVTNGTFDTDSDWLKSNATISGGKATINIVSGAFAYIDQFISYTNGRVYNIKATLNGTSGKIARVLDAGGNNGGLTTSSQGLITLDGTDQNIDITWTANSNSAAAHFARDSSGDWSFTVDNVSIKEVIDADFDFTRGSSATRVNELGLVQDVQILSGELVQNGDFEQIGSEQVTNGDFSDDSDWTLGNGWSIEAGELKANFPGGTVATAQVVDGFSAGKFYKVSFEVTEITSGYFRIYVYSGSAGTFTNLITTPELQTGTYEAIFEFGGTDKTFRIYGAPDSNSELTIGSIDNVSVKEVGQNWSFTDGAFFTENGINITNSPTAGGLNTDGYTPLVIGRKYRMTYEIIENNAGLIKLVSAVDETMVSTVGTHTKEFIAQFTDIIIFRSGSTVDVTIDNISVIEITDDTDLPRINYTNFDYEDVLGDELVTNGTFDTDSGWAATNSTISISNGVCQVNPTATFGYLNSTSSFQTSVGKKYVYSFDCISRTGSGNVYLQIGTFQNGNNVTNQNIGNIEDNTSYNITFTATSTTSYLRIGFAGSGTSAIIDNVSVKEFTEDVVVPYSGEGSLLLEPQRSNLEAKSNEFSTWTLSAGIDLTSNQSGVGGSNNAWLLKKNVDGSRYIQQSLSLSSAQYSCSFYLKAESTNWALIWCYDGSSGTEAYFDLENGVVGNTGGSNFDNATIENVGNGWYRCTLIYTSATTLVRIYPANTNGNVSTGTDNGIYIQYAQLEQGSYATSYIPTNGSTVTRLADACNNSGSSDLINSTEGVLYAEIAALADDLTFRFISISDGTTANRVFIGYQNVSNNFYVLAGTAVAFISHTITDITKIAVKYKSGDTSIFINGIEAAVKTDTYTLNGLNSLQFDSGGGGSKFYGNVKCVAVFKEALSYEELQCLTS